MRTLVAVPCMDMVHAAFMRSLLRMERIGELDYEVAVGSLIYDARNQLAEKALEDGYDRVLWLDSDMSFGPGLLRQLSEDLDGGKEMVSGLYFKRKPPFEPVIYKNCGLYRLEEGKLDPVATPYRDFPDDSCFEIEACGFGAVLMDVGALRRTVDRFGAMPFFPAGGFGEDLSFCLRWREAGGKIWCDSRARCGHVGLHVYGEEDYLRGGGLF